ncbi:MULTISPECIES: hypothetical protein [unclassified Fusibacter]|uniref:hypothetical protein n=1 Tax=unclassified Fusibacter TaxID=2624464 RepID=UPI001012D3B9|nr:MULTISPECIES: hypothetical protein [unclassified Fusibacter]MCK8060533.1 hypothetical protein [Fusibacter sp. A2]NPE23013.1 hypothetical protein [Fusibacter sp. A1]RXV60078.1 hypothetical protein DWB64_14300 [Fusibacter sp. A1]
MKYTCEVMINKPRELVVEAYRNTEWLSYWYEGFVSIKPLMRNFGVAGSKAILKCEQNGEISEISAVVESVNEPESVTLRFQMENVWYRAISELYEDDTEAMVRTRWVQRIEFHFPGILAITSLLNKKFYYNNTLRKMNRFKAFVETHDFENQRVEE